MQVETITLAYFFISKYVSLFIDIAMLCFDEIKSGADTTCKHIHMSSWP